MSPLEIFAALITVVSVWLTARERLWCWPTGIVSVLLYAWIFWQARLYANAALQLLYLPVLIYGWIKWQRRAGGGAELPVTRTPLAGWVVTLALSTVVSLAVAWALRRHTDAAMPLSDASTTIFSIAAEWMTARKWIENWLFWIVIDGWTTWMLIEQKLYPSAALYGFFVPLALYGWWEWRKSLQSFSASA
jgi:nicotinamide mononucleotide transporter